jgi:hypothetical protein
VATEDAPVFERQDRLHRVSGEWIQSIHTEPRYPLYYQQFGFTKDRFAEELQKGGTTYDDC